MNLVGKEKLFFILNEEPLEVKKILLEHSATLTWSSVMIKIQIYPFEQGMRVKKGEKKIPLMVSSRLNKPKLELIKGGLSCKTSLGSIEIVAAPKEAPPFKVDAFVFEEDTFLVMSADPTVREPKASMVRIMSNLMKTKPAVPGSILVRGQKPFSILAIVHDFNEEPSLKEEWVTSALDAIFRKSEDLQVHSMAIPLLGVHYGFLKAERFIELLGQALKRIPLQHLKRLWLIVPGGTARDIVGMLKANLEQQQL